MKYAIYRCTIVGDDRLDESHIHRLIFQGSKSDIRPIQDFGSGGLIVHSIEDDSFDFPLDEAYIPPDDDIVWQGDFYPDRLGAWSDEELADAIYGG